jgi:serine/threonine-protein kinase
LVYYKLGQYDNAVKNFDEALRQDPKLTDAFYSRGNAHFAQKQYQAAIKDYDEVIKQTPKSAKAYYHRGEACTSLASSKKRFGFQPGPETQLQGPENIF